MGYTRSAMPQPWNSVLSRLVLHRICQRADLFDFDGNSIARAQPTRRLPRHADPLRRTGHDHGAGQQCGAAAEKLDQGGDVENHVSRVRFLPDVAVDDGLDRQCIRVRNLIGGDEAGTERAERVEGFAATPLAAAALDLPIAGAHVVTASIAEPVIERVFTGNVLAGFADDHRQLALVIHLLALEVRRDQDRVAGILHGPDPFREQDGILRQLRVGLLRVTTAVNTAEQDLHRHYRREQLLYVGLLLGYGKPTEDVALDATAVGPMTNAPARILIANDLHRLFSERMWRPSQFPTGTRSLNFSGKSPCCKQQLPDSPTESARLAQDRTQGKCRPRKRVRGGFRATSSNRDPSPRGPTRRGCLAGVGEPGPRRPECWRFYSNRGLRRGRNSTDRRGQRDDLPGIFSTVSHPVPSQDSNRAGSDNHCGCRRRIR